MRKCDRAILILLATLAIDCKLCGQEAAFGVAMPLTVTGGAVRTEQYEPCPTGKCESSEDEHKTFAPGFRALLRPSIKLGRHWFAYSAIQFHSTPYFYYEAYSPQHNLRGQLLQAFAGYTRESDRRSISVKAGRLPSAFGSFPLRYDDTQNPLLDLPIPYSSYVQLRSDRLPCGVTDFVHGRGNPSYVAFYCGPKSGPSYGLWPVTLYGIPGVETDVSYGRMDGRFQLTNSSPANPQGLSRSRHTQWTAGGGATIRQGFRVGMSGYRGPFLNDSVEPFLPAGTTVRNFPATGVGVDVQWASGRWSAQGEWQRFQFTYPRLRTSPALTYSYVELKSIVNARLYAAARIGYRNHNRIADRFSVDDQPFLQNRQCYELAMGYRLNRWQLLKVGYEWFPMKGPVHRDNIFSVQFVTSVASLSKAIH